MLFVGKDNRIRSARFGSEQCGRSVANEQSGDLWR